MMRQGNSILAKMIRFTGTSVLNDAINDFRGSTNL